MIIGDPYRFSILIDVVDKWSSNGFVAGIFNVTVNGYLFPHTLVNTTLNSEIFNFFHRKESSLLNKPKNVELFHLKKEKLFKILYYNNHCDLEDNSEKSNIYAVCFSEMENQKCHLYAISDGSNIKILGLEFPDGEITSRNIQEVTISHIELDEIIFRFKEFYDQQILS